MPKTTAMPLVWTQDPTLDQFVEIIPAVVQVKAQQLAYAIEDVDRTVTIRPSE
jgi:hypothetical protein